MNYVILSDYTTDYSTVSALSTMLPLEIKAVKFGFNNDFFLLIIMINDFLVNCVF